MFAQQLELDVSSRTPPTVATPKASTLSFVEQVRAFRDFGEATRSTLTLAPGPDGTAQPVETLVNEFWTARQRQASSLHEVSYRACFKPQLPRFFIERLTNPGDVVYDPFMGRGTTPIEAALLGRVPFGCDINPLSLAFVPPRLRPPTLNVVADRLAKMELSRGEEFPEELLVFYHPDTLRDIVSLKEYFLRRQREGTFDALDGWIRLVSINRLTGHSNGFFSVYTLPPNQAVSVKSQTKINADRQQVPTPRDVRKLILKKSKQLLGDCDATARNNLAQVADRAVFINAAAHATPQIAGNSVSLVVTSPPFLDVVDYATDNWLRCWFLGIDAQTVKITVPKKLEIWTEAMTAVFRELHRVLKPGGHVAFEVGEVRGGKIRLEEAVIPCGRAAGLEPEMVLINDQEFTKTANCWGVDNNAKGTNTNRIVLFRKPA